VNRFIGAGMGCYDGLLIGEEEEMALKGSVKDILHFVIAGKLVSIIQS
jgi:hypothetical protein